MSSLCFVRNKKNEVASPKADASASTPEGDAPKKQKEQITPEVDAPKEQKEQTTSSPLGNFFKTR